MTKIDKVTRKKLDDANVPLEFDSVKTMHIEHELQAIVGNVFPEIRFYDLKNIIENELASCINKSIIMALEKVGTYPSGK